MPINILPPLQLSHKDLNFEKDDLEETLEPRLYETLSFIHYNLEWNLLHYYTWSLRLVKKFYKGKTGT